MFNQTIRRPAILLATARWSSSARNDLINMPPEKYVDHRQELKDNIWRDVDVTGKRSMETHLSNAEQLIKEIPVLYVQDDVVRCMGGVMPGSGHPQVYIQVNTRTPGEPVSCKYCGLRFALDTSHHH